MWIAAALLSLTLAAPPPELAWETFSPDRIEFAKRKNQPALLAFWADWCMTCKMHGRVVFSSPEVIDAFAKTGVMPVRADYTNEDPIISKWLEKLGRSSVPTYVLYVPNKKPRLLAEGLTIAMVTEALAGAAKQAPTSAHKSNEETCKGTKDWKKRCKAVADQHSVDAADVLALQRALPAVAEKARRCMEKQLKPPVRSRTEALRRSRRCDSATSIDGVVDALARSTRLAKKRVHALLLHNDALLTRVKADQRAASQPLMEQTQGVPEVVSADCREARLRMLRAPTDIDKFIVAVCLGGDRPALTCPATAKSKAEVNACPTD